MAENLNLSQKLFTQKDGKLFAYAEDIQEKVRELKQEFDKNDRKNNSLDVPENRNPIIDKIFGEKLSDFSGKGNRF